MVERAPHIFHNYSDFTEKTITPVREEPTAGSVMRPMEPADGCPGLSLLACYENLLPARFTSKDKTASILLALPLR